MNPEEAAKTNYLANLLTVSSLICGFVSIIFSVYLQLSAQAY